MSDFEKLINASDLIEWIIETCPDWCEGAIRSIVDHIDEMPPTQPEQRWIPCGERLPDNDDSVLISNRNGVTKAWWNGRFWTSIAVKKYKTVTAWMPLPEPYREEGDE